MLRSQAFDFKDKSVIVTGAGRGIGRVIAKALYDAGATVFAVNRSPENLQTLVAECPGVQAVKCDLSNYKETRSVIGALPRVDYLVNNAGVNTIGSIFSLTEQDFTAMFTTNLQAVLNITQIVTEKMMEAHKPGGIVNISSDAGMRPMPHLPGYSILKAGLDQMTLIMTKEYGPKGIRVNSINPGPVQTDMLQTFLDHVKDKTGADAMDIMKGKTPYTRHVTEKREIANTVMFLLSDAAPMIHGAILPIDGGLYLFN